jgi:hypothetical protein
VIVLDALADDEWVLDPMAGDVLVLWIHTLDATAPIAGTLQCDVAITGAMALDPLIDGQLATCALVLGVLMFSPHVAGELLTAPVIAGVLEIDPMSLECGKLLMNNTVGVRLVGVEVDGVPLNDATCTFTVFLIDDDTGDTTAVVGAEDLAMAYTGTPGRYRGLIPNTLPLIEGRRYRIVGTATKAGVGVGEWEADKLAVKRSASTRT